MDPYSRQNLKVRVPHLGSLYFNPKAINPKDIYEASLIACPRLMENEEREALVEWAASSRAPIFLVPDDIEAMVSEGFGAHRFHKLDAYKEIDFQGGSVTFYPVRKENRMGLSSLWLEMKALFGFTEAPSFHVLIKPKDGPAVLLLSAPVLDAVDWMLLSKFSPQHVLGLGGHPASRWKTLSERLKIEIIAAEQKSNFDFCAQSATEELAARNNSAAFLKDSDSALLGNGAQ